jgi:hypothetical protein
MLHSFTRPSPVAGPAYASLLPVYQNKSGFSGSTLSDALAQMTGICEAFVGAGTAFK